MQKESTVEACYSIKVERSNRYPISSKTFWVAIVCIVLGVYLIINGKRDEGLQLIMLGLGLLGLRDAINKTIRR